MSLMWKLPPKYEPRAILSVICKWQEFYLLISRVHRHLPAAPTSNCAFPGMNEKTGKCNQSLGKPHTPYLGRLCSPNKKQYEQNLSQWPQHHFPGTWEKAHMGLSNQDISRVASFSDPKPFLCSHTLWFIFSPEALYSSVEKHWDEATVLSILTDSAVSWVDGDYWHGQRVNQEHLSRVFAWCWHIGKIASNYR